MRAIELERSASGKATRGTGLLVSGGEVESSAETCHRNRNQTHALRLGLWSFTIQAARIGINAVVFLIFARWLKLAELGGFMTAFAILQFCQIFLRSGVSTAIIARSATDANVLDAAFSLSAVFATALSLAMFAAAFVLYYFSDSQQIALFLACLAPVAMIDGLSAVPEAVLRQKLAFRSLAIRTALALLLSALVAIGLSVIGFGVWALVSFNVVASIVSCVITWSVCGWRPGGMGQWAQARALLAPSLHFSTANVALGTLVPVSQMVVFSMLGAEAAGAYAIAQRMVTMIGALTLEPARQVALPLLARMDPNGIARREAFLDIVATVVLLTTPVNLGLVVVGGTVLALLLGPNGYAAGTVFEILCLSYITMTIAGSAFQIIAATGHSRELLRITVGMAISNLVMSIVGAMHSPIMVAALFVLRGCGTAIAYLILIRNRAGISTEIITRRIFPILLAGFLMAASVYAIKQYSATHGMGSLEGLLMSIATGAVVYPLALLLLASHDLTLFLKRVRQALVSP